MCFPAVVATMSVANVTEVGLMQKQDVLALGQPDLGNVRLELIQDLSLPSIEHCCCCSQEVDIIAMGLVSWPSGKQRDSFAAVLGQDGSEPETAQEDIVAMGCSANVYFLNYQTSFAVVDAEGNQVVSLCWHIQPAMGTSADAQDEAAVVVRAIVGATTKIVAWDLTSVQFHVQSHR